MQNIMMKYEIYVENAKMLHDYFYNCVNDYCENEYDKITYMKMINDYLLLCDKYDLHVVSTNDFDYDKNNMIYDCESFFIVNDENEIVAIIDNDFYYYNVIHFELFYDNNNCIYDENDNVCIYDKNNNKYFVCNEIIVCCYYENYFKKISKIN